MSKYTEIIVKTTHIGSEIVADILQSITNEGVVIVDRDDLNISAWDYIDTEAINSQYSDDEVIIKGYTSFEEIPNILSQLEKKLKDIDSSIDAGSLSISYCESDSEDWCNNWKQYFTPIKIGEITICPEWLNTQATNDKTVLLDSGMAFGTGQHETTRLIIELMQDIDMTDRHTLDIGCGSGILGISSLKLNARYTTMIDIDSQATEATAHNAILNNVYNKCTIACGDLSCITDAKYKVVFANLTSEILSEIFKDICKVVYPGGYLILSGILNTRLEEIKQMFISGNFNLIKQITEGDWGALLLRSTANE